MRGPSDRKAASEKRLAQIQKTDDTISATIDLRAMHVANARRHRRARQYSCAPERPRRALEIALSARCQTKKPERRSRGMRSPLKGVLATRAHPK